MEVTKEPSLHPIDQSSLSCSGLICKLKINFLRKNSVTMELLTDVTGSLFRSSKKKKKLWRTHISKIDVCIKSDVCPELKRNRRLESQRDGGTSKDQPYGVTNINIDKMFKCLNIDNKTSQYKTLNPLKLLLLLLLFCFYIVDLNLLTLQQCFWSD